MFFKVLANISQNSETPSLLDGPFLMGNTVHSANSWKVSGRKSHNAAFYIHQQEQHSGDWPPKGGHPLSAYGGLPPIQGAEWASLRLPVETYGTLLSTHSAPAFAGERWWRQPPKGGCCRRQHLYSSPPGDTTTFTAAGCVKPPNPRGASPVNLKNPFFDPCRMTVRLEV